MTVGVRSGFLQTDFLAAKGQEILILNLMPNRRQTEADFLDLFASTRKDVNLTFIIPASHDLKHDGSATRQAYKTFNDVQEDYFDVLLVTGAPLEFLPFSQIDYFDEFLKILDWRKQHVLFSTFECWSAMAIAKIEYGLAYSIRSKKVSGVYELPVLSVFHNLKTIKIPESRYFQIDGIADDWQIITNDHLGSLIALDQANRTLLIAGHPEYAEQTLANEYARDLKKGLDIDEPDHYFDKNKIAHKSWADSAALLFSSWLDLAAASKAKKN
ncbi:homoserine O-succinyltransferase [Oenococcus sicerae]|uniref:Homoserine O-acetyltransferase n=1 Tax=Oenococcus sicerae TaxID=2203724 RepID=A0ABX5QN09_9LACO|nr:homoserine O-succinyltransferase [Oenococcus sicerae]QAS70165.1 homoserine O-succinyltransferase [Oenococcus sicerae]